MTRSRYPKNNHGFALLMALLALVISATALGLLSQRRLQHVLATERKAGDLQTRWAQRSLADTLLPQANTWLTEINTQQPGTPTTSLNLELNGLVINARIDNEHAKANPATLTERFDPITYRNTMTELIGPRAQYLIDPTKLQQANKKQVSTRFSDSVRRPADRFNTRKTEDTTESGATNALSWSQVFDANHLDGETLWAVGQHLTVYTDGLLDLKQADSSIIQAVASPPLNPAEVARLIDERQARPEADAFSLVYAVADTPNNDGVRQAQQLFTNQQAEVYSLWLRIGSGPSAKRSFAVLLPEEENDANQPSVNRTLAAVLQNNTEPQPSDSKPSHRILRQSL